MALQTPHSSRMFMGHTARCAGRSFTRHPQHSQVDCARIVLSRLCCILNR